MTRKAAAGAGLPGVALGLLTALFAWICVRFAMQDGLASLADDSASYLVMAQVFSPYAAATDAVRAAFAAETVYPPLFPLVLALTGTAHDIGRAHVLTALLLAACLPLLHALARRWLGGRWTALAIVAVTACLPSLWINVKGILSEPLFLLILLALYIALEDGGRSRRSPWLLAALMTALVLTRAVGLVMLAGWAGWVLTRRDEPLRARLARGTPALVAVLSYGAWTVLRPSAPGGGSEAYASILLESGARMLDAGHLGAAVFTRLGTQLAAMGDAWVGSLMLFWVEGRSFPVALSFAVGALALGGVGARFAQGRADAWMTAACLATFLLWPFPGQMTRFLFPLLPLLIVYAFWFAAALARRWGSRPGAVHAVLAATILSLALPALGFMHDRARLGRENGFAAMTEWYRTPDLTRARERAAVHRDLLSDMQALREKSAPRERVMWVTPAYIALLAQREAVPAPPATLAPEPYRRAVAESCADLVFLSLYHPRDTVSDAAWRAGRAALGAQADPLYQRAKADGSVQAVLLRPRAGEAKGCPAKR